MPQVPKLPDPLFERVLAWTVHAQGEDSLRAARRAFESATGAMVEGAPDYEARISHFWEQHLCSGEPAPVSAFAAAHPALSGGERRILSGWLRSHRSLFTFEALRGEQGERAVLHDRVLGGHFEFHTRPEERSLRPGDSFDARLVAIDDALWLSPGRVYHPPEAHAALGALLERLDRRTLPHAALLDALLLMRSRFLQFASIRAEHVYHERSLALVQPRRGSGVAG